MNFSTIVYIKICCPLVAKLRKLKLFRMAFQVDLPYYTQGPVIVTPPSILITVNSTGMFQKNWKFDDIFLLILFADFMKFIIIFPCKICLKLIFKRLVQIFIAFSRIGLGENIPDFGSVIPGSNNPYGTNQFFGKFSMLNVWPLLIEWICTIRTKTSKKTVNWS